ncbi:MAG: hypothetical protein KAJ12_13770, partial [Bacteroidetes bacterium]|nr:hypothetical protein [Bacteroidota bacterium]
GKSLKDLPQERRLSLATNLIKYDTRFASVRYMQERYYRPSYFGVLISGGVAMLSTDNGAGAGYLVGLGYSAPWTLLPDFLLVHRLSATISYTRFLDETERTLLSVMGGLSFLIFPDGFLLIEYLRLEAGYAWGIRSPLKSHGGVFSFSLETGTIPLGFTNTGLLIRPQFKVMHLEKTLFGASIEVVFH